MKLIRLTTTDSTCQFRSNFDQDIIVGPDSQIALQNLSMERVIGSIIINGSNDQITYTIAGNSHVKTIVLDHATYTNANIGSLSLNMKIKLNASLESFGKQIGHQFDVVDTSSDGKFHIKTVQADFVNHYEEFNTIGDGNIYVDGLNLNKEDVALNGNNNTYITYLQDPLCKGSGVFRCRMRNQKDIAGALGTDGVIMGLSSVDPSTVGSFDYTNMTYAIYYPSNTVDGAGVTVQKFHTIQGASPVASAKDIEYIGDDNANNNFMEIKIAEGKVTAQTFSNTDGSTPTVLFETAYNGTQDLYPFIINRGTGSNAGTVLDNVRVTTDPFLDPPASLAEGDYELGSPLPPRPVKNATGYINFESIDLALALGFETKRIPEIGTDSGGSYDWYGSFKFTLTDLTSTFLVQMMSMELESYDDYTDDGSGGGARNLLCIIPNGASESIAYEPSNLIWIGLKNMHPLSLRNVFCRIVQSDYSELQTRGLTTMTILVKDKNE